VLATHLNETRSFPDWHRLARGLISSAEEKSLREEQTDLQWKKQAEQFEFYGNQKQRAEMLREELAALCRQSFLQGFILPKNDANLPLRPGEILRWHSSAQMCRLRSVQGQNYWEVEKTGQLLVTDQRIYLMESVLVEPYWRWLKKLSHIEIVYGSGLPLLKMTFFSGLKKPLGFAVDDMKLSTEIDGYTQTIFLTAEDLAQVLAQNS